MKKLITNIAIIITIILTSVNYSVGQSLYVNDTLHSNLTIEDTTHLTMLVYNTDTVRYESKVNDVLKFKHLTMNQPVEVILVEENDTLYKIIKNDTTNELYAYLRKNSDGSLSVNEIEVSNLKVYPNPVIDVLNISFDSNENVDVIVMDMSGRIIHNEPSSTLTTVNLSDQPSGMYLVKIGNKTQRIIKQ